MLTPKMAPLRPISCAGARSIPFLFAGVLLFGVFGPMTSSFAAEPPRIAVTEALPTLLQRGTEAFAAGDYAAAAAAFSRVEQDFAGEAAWRSGTLPRRLLPLRGFAELRAGMAEDAADSLAAFLEQFPDEASQRSFVLYTLALALRETGRLEEALDRFSTFETENPESSQAALAHFQRAEILFELNRPVDALQALRELSGSGGISDALRGQARLRALQKAVELEQNQIATELLFEEQWQVSTMPEIAVLAFAAMEMGDRFMAEEKPEAAIRAYRFVLPKGKLVEAQQQRLDELTSLFAARAPAVAAGSGSFWIDFYRGRIARIEAQLQSLKDAEDFTVPLQMRIGQAYLVAERFREAWLFFERIAVRADLPADLRRPAHYRWILAASGLERWEDALAIARTFVERYPDSDLAPEAFYLISRAHLEQRRYPEADEVLTDTLVRFPDAPSTGRTLFTRGWVRAMLEQFDAARADFDRYDDKFPDGSLAASVALWRALTSFFQKDYGTALEAFDHLVERFPTNPLFPEILYRRGTTLYAMRDFDRARRQMETFVRDFRGHPRHPEALVLLGDILMGAGDLPAAKDAFAAVDPEARASFVYAAFQMGKILRAEENHNGMVDHFTNYATRTDLGPLPRISEALYWIGLAQEKIGQPEKALTVYFDVLDRFGNDPEAGEVSTSLGALERLVRRLSKSQGPLTQPPDVDPRHELLLAGDFESWIDEERDHARRDDKFTLYARLTVHRAEMHRKSKQPYQQEALLLEIAAAAPLESLDAAALADVGLVLQDIGSEESTNYFYQLLDRFPGSFERAAAYYGLARAALKERSFEEAFSLLQQFDNETPTHPLAPRATLLHAQALEQNGQLDEAFDAYEEMLRLKSARGRLHAEALMGMARCSERNHQPEKSIAYSQRVYNMYRAYEDLAADAYMTSARLFESTGDLRAAANTYAELLATPGVGDAVLRENARVQLGRLEPLIPPEPSTPPVAAQTL